MNDFLLTDLLMGPRVADRLAAAYLDGCGNYATDHAHEFWNGRLLDYRRAPPEIAEIMRRYMRKAIANVRAFHDCGPLYPDVLNLVGWPDGMAMPVHADNCEMDGSSNGLEHRAHSGNFYLTSCDGGELFLPNQGRHIRPRPGRFVSLPCGLSHPHGVMPALNGHRITLTFFMTHDPSKADASLMA